jgi:predicted CoA-substrate-specific enzyme activase
MKVLGIDLGSRTVKIVLFEDNELIHYRIFETSEFYKDFCRKSDKKIHVDFGNLNLGEFDKVVSTGYGRNNVNVDGAEVILELKAHTLGAVRQTGLQDFTLLDMGGQDSKAILVRQGRVSDLLLNDKCAASCGRYLENMANLLGMKLREVEKHFDNPVELSSTCAVFAESELIGRISEGFSLAELAAGINHSLFKRIKPLIERFPSPNIVITGGVAENKALIQFIKTQSIFDNVIVPKYPQINGAIGCCMHVIGS